MPESTVRNRSSLTPPAESTVRSLIPSVTPLAEHLDITPNAIYRWIKMNRVPAKYLLKIASFYDIDIPMHLAQSDERDDKRMNLKPRETLPICLQVQAGTKTLEEAAAELGLHTQAIRLILKNWGAALPVLYRVLVQLENEEISLDQAADTLRVGKLNIHVLRKKYGFKPKPRAKAKELPIVKRRATARSVALACISGSIKLDQVSEHCDLSWRTIHRTIAKLSPEYSLIDLTHWPISLRQAYAKEIEQNAQKISVKLWKYVELTQIFIKKRVKYPASPENWRLATARKMLIHILLGDESVQSIAEKRGADPFILESLFTSTLRPLDLTWQQVAEAPVLTQIALAEVLLALEESKRTPRERMLERLEEENND